MTDELGAIGARSMVAVLADLAAHRPVPQSADGVTYAGKIEKAESRLDLAAAVEQVGRQIRAFAPAPGAWFELDGERYRVLAADVVEGSGQPGTTLDDRLTIACGQGAIRPTLIQRAGRPAMEIDAFLRGKPIPRGTVIA